MAYQVPDIAGGQRANRAALAARRDKLIARLMQQQDARNKRDAALAKQAQSEVADFYTHFEAQPKSTDLMFNAAAEDFVRRKAIAQEKAYEEAYGPDGTAELRAKYNAQVAKDKRELTTIGEWMVLGNDGNTQISNNASAIEKNIEVGRMVRSSSTALQNKFQFQTNLSGGNYHSLKIDYNEAGNIVLNGYDKDGNLGEGDSRNLDADVANAKKGLDWFTSIEEGDKLGVIGGKQWNVGVKDGNQTLVAPLKDAFTPQQREYTSYNEETNITTKTFKKVYDKDEIVNRLTNENHKEYIGNRLDSIINSNSFEKQWDQLYRGGYISSKTDSELKNFGAISWDMVGKMRTLSGEQIRNQLAPIRKEFPTGDAGDAQFQKATDEFNEFYKELAGDDGELSQAERIGFVNKMKDAARHGLANYYADQLAPASENETLKVTTVEGKPEAPSGGDGITANKRLAIATHKAALDANKLSASNILKTKYTEDNIGDFEQAFLKEIKRNAELEKDGTTGNSMAIHTYVTAADAATMLDKTDQDEVTLQEGALYRMEPVYTTGDATKIQQWIPVMIARPESLKRALTDEKELRRLLNNGIKVDSEAELYYNQLP